MAYPWPRQGVGDMASNPLGHIVGCRMSPGKQVPQGGSEMLVKECVC